MKDVYLFALKNWENACRLRDERIAELERENAALKEELAPLRETVGVRGDAVTSRDDIDYWSKLVDRADKAVRLETENAALREDRDRLDDVLASFYPAVAPLVVHYPVTPWEHMKDGRCRGSWAEDGSPYYFTVPHQLVPAFFALQLLAKLCRDKDAARAEEAQP